MKTVWKDILFYWKRQTWLYFESFNLFEMLISLSHTQHTHTHTETSNDIINDSVAKENFVILSLISPEKFIGHLHLHKHVNTEYGCVMCVCCGIRRLYHDTKSLLFFARCNK